LNQGAVQMETKTLIGDLLILRNGRIFVQNLTQPMVELLHRLNPKDKIIASRVQKIRTSL